ncbi:hypothetical protein [Sandaracinus amylolyticus]|uniref:hypothetical protein n=1 Tax=Sandaracinus amylolyticus TaxID=927083 RepID=UPI001F343BCE|nr:hypothetical protein [Sandaracinus amylolyticus]
MDALGKKELSPGLALVLDPDLLARAGASHTALHHRRVRQPHTFLCLEHGNGIGKWAPLFSAPGERRVAVPTEGRVGEQRWQLGTFHLHLDQIWTATDDQIRAANRDTTKMHHRNRVDVTSLLAAIRELEGQTIS